MTVFIICFRRKGSIHIFDSFFNHSSVFFILVICSAKILKQVAQVLGRVTKNVRLLPDLLQDKLVGDHCSKCFVFFKNKPWDTFCLAKALPVLIYVL